MSHFVLYNMTYRIFCFKLELPSNSLQQGPTRRGEILFHRELSQNLQRYRISVTLVHQDGRVWKKIISISLFIDVYKYTWLIMAEGRVIDKALMDYVLLPRRMLGRLLDVKVWRGD